MCKTMVLAAAAGILIAGLMLARAGSVIGYIILGSYVVFAAIAIITAIKEGML